MPTIEELNDQIRLAEQKLIALARQNTEYNAEIVRLKAVKDDAEKMAKRYVAEFDLLDKKCQVRSVELAGIISAIQEQKSDLSNIEASRVSAFNDAVKEKSSLSDVILRLRSEKSALETEISSLQNRQFNMNVTLNTQTFTMSENEQKINRLKSELSSIERRIDSAKMELGAVEAKIKEKSDQFSTLARSLEARESDLALSIKDKTDELASLSLKIKLDRERSDAEIIERRKALSEEADAVAMAKANNDSSARENESLRQALVDREQELRLFELKIKELARKKDINAQIASLSILHLILPNICR